jgi:hypothetical protein
MKEHMNDYLDIIENNAISSLKGAFLDKKE